MKKMVLGLSLALVTLCLFLSPALAATNPADQAFLSSLAVPEEPTPAAKPLALGAKALCTASASCWNGTTVSCQGNNGTTSCSATDSNCPGTRGAVTCDGVTTQCPPCPCDLDCVEYRASCVEDCYPCFAIPSCNVATCTATCRCKTSSCVPF